MPTLLVLDPFGTSGLTALRQAKDRPTVGFVSGDNVSRAKR
jgi:hypothetical protein